MSLPKTSQPLRIPPRSPFGPSGTDASIFVHGFWQNLGHVGSDVPWRDGVQSVILRLAFPAPAPLSNDQTGLRCSVVYCLPHFPTARHRRKIDDSPTGFPHAGNMLDAQKAPFQVERRLLSQSGRLHTDG